MTSIFIIAEWFLSQSKMTHKKLQKLCFYAKAWSCAICPEPITDAVFEAWVHGPVNRELYEKYKDYGFKYIPQCNKPTSFSNNEESFLGDVWDTYGDMSANALEALTQSELPWQKAHSGVDSGEQSSKLINENDMTEYYRSIYTGGVA